MHELTQNKSDHLTAEINWRYHGLEGVADGVRPLDAFVERLAAQPRPRFRFEYHRKTEILQYLREHYRHWSQYNPQSADALAALPAAETIGTRKLDGIVALGRTWWATDNPRYGAAFERFFIETPSGKLFNHGAFTGSQVATELDAWFLLLDCPAFSAEGRIAFLDHLVSAAEFAWHRETSRWTMMGLGPENHNWYLHGIHMLPLFGLLFPEFKSAQFCLDTGWSVAEEHLRAHYRPDFGARETAMNYQKWNVDALWDFCLMAQRNGHPTTADFAERTLQATLYLLRLASPVGGQPSFGDGRHTPGDLIVTAAVAAALTGDRECKGYVELWRKATGSSRASSSDALPEAAFWKVGLAGAERYATVCARTPGSLSVLMPFSGMAAMRDRHAAAAHYLAVCAAERGPIVTSHGHNDIFSMEVHADGQRFIGEMGCAEYYGDAAAREYDVKTEAHSCLTIRDEEQLPIVNQWRWKGQLRPAVTRWIAERDHDFFEGVHEGFYRFPDRQALHWRKIFFRKPADETECGYWLIFDRIEANRREDWVAYFHGCAPARIDGTRVWLEPDAPATRLAILAPENEEWRWEHVSSPGLSAYIEQKKIEPERYPCVCARRAAVSDCFVWALVPVRDADAAPRLRKLAVSVDAQPVAADEATGVEIAWQGRTERVLLHHRPYDASMTCDGLSHRGLLARWSRDDRQWIRKTAHTVVSGVCAS